MLLSVLILALLAATAWRGWRRGLIVETVDVVGVVAVLGVGVLVWSPARTVISAATPLEGTGAAFLGSLVVVLAGLLGVGWVSRWAAREGSAYVPPTLVRTARVSGAVFAATWMTLLISGFLTLGLVVPGAKLKAAGPVCDAPVARYLAGPANPLHGGAEGVARIGQPVLLWVSQRVFDTFTLGATADVATAATAATTATTAPAEDVPTEPAVDPTPPACAELERLRATAEAANGITPAGFRFEPADVRELSRAPEAERTVLDLLNQARQAQGLPVVQPDLELAEVARAHALDMYVRGYFSHDTPDCDAGDDAPGCLDPFDRIRAGGVTYVNAGENLALAPTPASAHDGLMRSPGHRANILEPRYGRVGIGAVDGPYGLMIVQAFAD